MQIPERGGNLKPLSRSRIIVVDDEPPVRELLKTQLTFLGYGDVSTATGDPLAELRNSRFDLMLLDIEMPGISGLQLLKKSIRERLCGKIIIVSGLHDLETMRSAIREGAYDYLAKPFELEDLCLTVERALQLNYMELKMHRLGQTISNMRLGNRLLKAQLISQEKARNAKTRDLTTVRALCGTVAHSLRGEFLHIGQAARTLQELSPEDTGIAEETDLIRRSVTYSEIMLKRLLDYVQERTPDLETVDLRATVKDVYELMRPRISNSIDFSFTLPKEPSLVETDAEQIKLILVELVANAKRALWKGSGKISIFLTDTTEGVELQVQDTGDGIPKPIRNILLKEPIPLKSKTGSKEGLGLGLHLSSTILVNLGGRLVVKQSSSKGTTMAIEIPSTSREQQ